MSADVGDRSPAAAERTPQPRAPPGTTSNAPASAVARPSRSMAMLPRLSSQTPCSPGSRVKAPLAVTRHGPARGATIVPAPESPSPASRSGRPPTVRLQAIGASPSASGAASRGASSGSSGPAPGASSIHEAAASSASSRASSESHAASCSAAADVSRSPLRRDSGDDRDAGRASGVDLHSMPAARLSPRTGPSSLARKSRAPRPGLISRPSPTRVSPPATRSSREYSRSGPARRREPTAPEIGPLASRTSDAATSAPPRSQLAPSSHSGSGAVASSPARTALRATAPTVTRLAGTA